MTRLPRPYLIALAAVAALGLAWVVLLRGHGPSPTSTPPTHHSTARSNGQNGLKHVYNGPVPGLHGLSEDVKKAQQTASSSERERRTVEHASVAVAQSQSAGTGGTASPAAKASSQPAGAASHRHAASSAHTGTGVATHSAAKKTSTKISRHGSGGAKAGRRSPAVAVAHELHAGRVVLLLFWNPHSSDDRAVHAQVQAVARKMGRKVAVHFAKAGEVGSFGTVTREVSVDQTPTLLIIGRKGMTTTITGLTDSFSIEQDVREARG